MPRLFLANLLALFSFFLVACEAQKKNTGTANELWSYESQIIEGGSSLSITEYNEAIEKALSMRLPWAYSPISVALRIAGQQMVSREVNIAAKSLSGADLITHAVVMVEKKGLQDDSVEDQYTRVELKLGGSIWQVVQVHNAYRCREGRGHQELSGELCL